MFDQGMAQAFGFNHEAAIRSFERAAELDPSAPMPHWGKAWALGPNYNLDIDEARAKTAYDALAKAQSLAATGADNEKAYVEALAVRYSTDAKADRAALARAFSQAMGDLSRRYPDDLDAAVIYAESLMNLTPWKLWTPDGTTGGEHRGHRHRAGIGAAAQSESPRRESLLHTRGRGFAHAGARAGKRTAPDHARRIVGASGSICPRTFTRARATMQAPRRRMRRARQPIAATWSRAPPNGMYGMMYYPHNLQFLADSHMMQGRFADAKQAADRVAEHLNPHAAMMPMVESVVVMPVSVLLRFSKHADVLGLQTPPADRPVQRAWHHFARGTALAKTGRVDEAAAERKLLATAIAAVPETAAFGGGGWATAASALSVASLSLDARIAAARAEHDRAIKFMAAGGRGGRSASV